jgi:hypothetical protein
LSLIGGIAGSIDGHRWGLFEKVKFTMVGGGAQSLGRWALSMFDGRFVHQNIVDSSPIKRKISWLIFHYLTGGCCIVLSGFISASKVSRTRKAYHFPCIWLGFLWE